MREGTTEGLDPEQRRAVESASRHLLVAAPPGSGKTRVLAGRSARLAGLHGPSAVLAVTFTNRAAREMRERVEGFGPGGPGGTALNIGTFHGFCLRFLKSRIGGFRLIGRTEQVEVLKGLGVGAPERSIERISSIKNTLTEDRGPLPSEDSELLAGYSRALDGLGALDLDDLLVKTLDILSGDGRGLFRHILVDEYQDINPVQTRLVGLLAGDGGGVTAIGDPDQSIYGFRGAGGDSFGGFMRAYPGAEVVDLKTNYRSGRVIVGASEAVMDAHSGRGLSAGDGAARAARDGGEVTVVSCPDDRAEAGFIVREIEALMGGLTNLSASAAGGRRGGSAQELLFSDFAVLARTNALSERLAGEFERSSIPFQLVGPAGAGDAALLGSLGRATAAPDETVADVIRRVAAETGAGVEAASRLAGEAESSGVEGGAAGPSALSAFLEWMLIAGPVDRFDIAADRVSIMTMHMTKGLEFDTVFVTGAEDGVIPLRPASGDCDVAEERRLFYVAMTRARERLFISHAARRMHWGAVRESQRSPFVAAIPSGLVRNVVVEKKKVKRRPVQDSLF